MLLPPGTPGKSDLGASLRAPAGISQCHRTHSLTASHTWGAMRRQDKKPSRRTRGTKVALLLFTSLAAGASPARAWLYPEHRAITTRGFEGLAPRDHAELDRLWREVRRGNESRLCEQASVGDQGLKPPCIDYAAWPAIAGDHSCSPVSLIEAVLQSDWILKVAAISARMAAKLAGTKSEDM